MTHCSYDVIVQRAFSAVCAIVSSDKWPLLLASVAACSASLLTRMPGG